jgi:O-antigen/teichoic acid export membrane protein
MKLDWNKIRNLLLKTKDLQYIAIGNIGGKVIIAIFWLYMAAVLGTEDYGQVNYLIALGAMGAGLSMVGTSNVVIIYTAKKIPIESTIYSIALILGTVSSIILYLFTENVIVSIFVFSYIFYNLGISELLGKKEYKKYSIILISQKIIFVSSSLILYNFMGFEGVVLGFTISMFIFSPIVIIKLFKTKINFKLLKPRFGFIINNYALVIEKVLSGQVDKLLIAPLFGFSILGNYALSMQILSVATILPSIVFQYTLSQDASGKSNILIKKFSILSSVIMTVLAITLTPILLPIIFPEYVEAVQLIQIVSLYIIPSSIILAYSSKLLGEEKSKYVLTGQAISACTYLGGIFSLGFIIGINGIAISFVIAAYGQAIFYFIISKYLKNHESNNNIQDN